MTPESIAAADAARDAEWADLETGEEDISGAQKLEGKSWAEWGKWSSKIGIPIPDRVLLHFRKRRYADVK